MREPYNALVLMDITVNHRDPDSSPMSPIHTEMEIQGVNSIAEARAPVLCCNQDQLTSFIMNESR